MYSNRHLTILTTVISVSMLAVSCSEDKITEETPDRNELYARAFVKEFGVPDPNHDWTMATTAGLRVNAPNAVDLKVYAEIDGQLFIFADIPGFQGNRAVPVTIPKGIDELIVTADHREYKCSPSDMLDLSDSGRSRAGAPHITISRPTYRGDLEINSENRDNGYAIIAIDDNEALVKIMTDPLNSEYLTTVSDDMTMLGGPFMGNASHMLSPYWSEDPDFEVYPLSIRDNDNPMMPKMDIQFCVVSDIEKLHKTHSLISGDFGIRTSDNGSNWTSTPRPSLHKGSYIKTPRIKIDTKDNALDERFGYTYAISTDKGISYTYSRLNYNPWGGNFYDATLREMNNCYCSTLFFKEVPIKWTNPDGKTESRVVAVYGIYKAPEKPAAPRPATPDVYLIEAHKYGEALWIEPFYDVKNARTYEWRIFAEDLGGVHDWDFNDLVVKYSDILTRYVPDLTDGLKVGKDEDGDVIYDDGHNTGFFLPTAYSPLYPIFSDQALEDNLMVRKITVTPLAAGGTMPIYLAWRGKLSTSSPVNPDILLSDYIKTASKQPEFIDGDFIIGHEMHKWLGGTSHYIQINVGDKVTHNGKSVTFYTTPEGYGGADTGFGQTPKKVQFTVLVDKDNTLASQPQQTLNEDGSINKIDIKQWNDGYIVNDPLIDDPTNVPQMLINQYATAWPREGISMGLAYNSFKYYISNPNTCSPTWTFHDSRYTVKEK